jgi:hypothetical protein
MQNATEYLNSLPANVVREWATDYFDVAGADWDGKTLSLLRGGQWYRHVDGPGEYQKTSLYIALARYIAARS